MGIASSPLHHLRPRRRVIESERASEMIEVLRAPVDGIALSEGFPVNGFRLMVALAACSVVAPLIHLAPSENARTFVCSLLCAT